MKFGEKIFKWVSYGFIVFIVGIIVLTFGMPEFIGTSADSDRYLAAKVGNEVITRKEVQNMKNYMMSLPQFSGFGSQESFLEKYALDYLINEKLQVILQKESGIYPLTDAKNTIIAQYLKENFKEYQSAEGFDFTRFETDFLKPRRISFTAVEEQALRSKVYDFRQLLDSFEPVSDLQIQDLNEFRNTRISYEILVFTADEKKQVLKKLIGITEADIQEKFKKDYLSKNKDDKLTDLKREAITTTIINEKKQDVEKKWIASLIDEIKSQNLAEIRKGHGGTLLSIDNVALSETLAEKNPDKKINLNPLESSKEFQANIKASNTGKILGPWAIDEGLYLMKIKSITSAENVAAVNQSESEIKNENKSSADQIMDSILRDKIKITRYNSID